MVCTAQTLYAKLDVLVHTGVDKHVSGDKKYLEFHVIVTKVTEGWKRFDLSHYCFIDDMPLAVKQQAITWPDPIP